MGLAASQARALLLVARKSDLEYRAQCLTQRKMVLAQQTEEIAKEYSSKISNRKLSFVYNLKGSEGEDVTEDLSFYSLRRNVNFVGEYRVVDTLGRVVVPSIDYLPKEIDYVPVYKKQNSDGTTVQNAKDSYDATDAKIGDEKEIWIQAFIDDKGTKGYVQIQNNKGEAMQQEIYQVSADGKTYSKLNVYESIKNDADPASETKLNGTFESMKLQYLAKKTVQSNNLYYTADTSTLEEGQSYVIDHYEQAEVSLTYNSATGTYVDKSGKQYVVAKEIGYTSYFQNGLRNGALTLEKANTVEQKNADGTSTGKSSTTWESIPWQGCAVIKDNYDTSDDAQAQSDFEAANAVLKCQDQALDMEIRQIETQHKAVETEWDSVKKVIEGNIDKTFKIFA